MVMRSGITTSRAIFSFGSSDGRWPLMRWTRRRNDATERWRSSSVVSAVTSVSRPRRFSSPAGRSTGFGAATVLPPRREGRASSSSSAWTPRPAPAAPLAAASSVPKRLRASCSALRLTSSSEARRASSLRLRASAGPRSDFSVSSPLALFLFGLALGLLLGGAARFLVALALLGGLALGFFGILAAGAPARVLLGYAALLRLAHARVGKRVRPGAALLLGQRAQHDPGRPRLTPGRGGGCGRLRRRSGLGRRGGTLGRRRCLALRLGTENAALDLLHHHGLGAAMAEALAHHALLDRALQGERLGHAQGLLAGVLDVSHFVRSSLPGSCSNASRRRRSLQCASVQASGSVRESSGSPRARAGQHVPHLTARAPSPIAARRKPRPARAPACRFAALRRRAWRRRRRRPRAHGPRPRRGRGRRRFRPWRSR